MYEPLAKTYWSPHSRALGAARSPGWDQRYPTCRPDSCRGEIRPPRTRARSFRPRIETVSASCPCRLVMIRKRSECQMLASYWTQTWTSDAARLRVQSRLYISWTSESTYMVLQSLYASANQIAPSFPFLRCSSSSPSSSDCTCSALLFFRRYTPRLVADAWY